MTRRSEVASSAPSISAPRRSSPSTPNKARSRRVCPRARKCRSATQSGSPSVRRTSWYSTRPAGVRRAARSTRATAMADIVLRRVCKYFGEIEAVHDFSLNIADGEFVVLLGPTGAGKTTTLRLVAGLEYPDSGAISIDRQEVTRQPPAVRDVAFVFQQYSLYPHLTVYDNLAFPLRSPARSTPEAEIRKRVGEIAALLHIETKLGSRSTRLSGGEMQRV